MEFGVLGSDGLVGSGNGFASLSSDHPAKQKWCGSATFLNKEISGISPDNDNGDWKVTKIAKLSDDLTPTKSLLPLKHSSSFVFSNEEQEQNMLSFSSPKLENKSLQSTTFPYFQHPNSYYSRSSGSSCSGSVNASMCYVNGVRGGFTPSQWFELEQQALIYKYILANQPIPPNLLIPIRRAFESAGFCSFPGGLLRPNSFGYGWGPFHLGLANSTDPEPGRCRRTDGKKWRCSRDAVPDQKYCERHMNRGRHRSRKPVEGHSGHSISGGTTKKASNSTTSVMNMTSTSSALVVPGGGPSNSFALNLNGSKDLQHVPSNLLPSSPVNRLMVNKANISQGMQDTSHATGIDILSPRISLSSNGNTFSVAESTAGDFAFLTSDAILSTTKTGSSVSRNYPQGSDPQYSPHAFIDDQTSMLWPKLQTHTDRTTQLSMSIPPAAEITSSTSSPTRERDALSPLRLSRELDSVQMGLGMYTTVSNEQKPISWESSMGGPLGEVLNVNTSSSSGEQSKSVPALNLLSRGSWEGSPQLASSPTGVLQRTALGYFSNSSAGSSPRPDNGFSLVSSSSSLPL